MATLNSVSKQLVLRCNLTWQSCTSWLYCALQRHHLFICQKSRQPQNSCCIECIDRAAYDTIHIFLRVHIDLLRYRLIEPTSNPKILFSYPSETAIIHFLTPEYHTNKTIPHYVWPFWWARPHFRLCLVPAALHPVFYSIRQSISRTKKLSVYKQDQDTWLCQTPPAGWGRKRGTDRPTDRTTDRPTKPFVGRPPGSGKHAGEKSKEQDRALLKCIKTLFIAAMSCITLSFILLFISWLQIILLRPSTWWFPKCLEILTACPCPLLLHRCATMQNAQSWALLLRHMSVASTRIHLKDPPW